MVVSNEKMSGNDPYHMYVYQLPYSERKKLCKILDLNNSWEELGGEFMQFDVPTLNRIGQAVIRNRSPTDELLTLWGTKNHTVAELFGHLAQMQHYQAMSAIKSLVDPKYHRLIYEGEENFSKILGNEVPVKQKQQIGRKENSPQDPNIDNDLKVSNNLNQPKNNQDKVLINNLERKEFQNRNIPNPGQNQNLKEEGARALRKLSEESNATFGEKASPAISYIDLEIATNGWDKKLLLGKGGFGTVYKGVWKNTHVAIKRLEALKGGDLEESWKTYREQSLRELKCLNSCRHDNILPLYGYSIDGPHDCLVYQYMPNGSLEDRLLCREGTKPLTWSQRHSVATGTARGLQFLHTIGDKPLIHGDIKSANILLDPYLEPKIGDFGLAREGPLQKYTHLKVSRVHGTRPYLPDEFLRGKRFSTKVDTFSFGIVLFELATGLRAYDETQPQKFLKARVETLSEEDKLHEIMDPKAGKDDGISFMAMVTLGKLCVAVKPKDRPEMVAVLQKLDTMTTTREMAQQNYARAVNNSPVNPEIGIPEVIIQPPISQVVLPPHVNEEGHDVCGGLPLISELGIKTSASDPEHQASNPN